MSDLEVPVVFLLWLLRKNGICIFILCTVVENKIPCIRLLPMIQLTPSNRTIYRKRMGIQFVPDGRPQSPSDTHPTGTAGGLRNKLDILYPIAYLSQRATRSILQSIQWKR